jgi:hypothetical protein
LCSRRWCGANELELPGNSHAWSRLRREPVIRADTPCGAAALPALKNERKRSFFVPSAVAAQFQFVRSKKEMKQIFLYDIYYKKWRVTI